MVVGVVVVVVMVVGGIVVVVGVGRVVVVELIQGPVTSTLVCDVGCSGRFKIFKSNC
jgi:hypothetical protein